MDVIVAQGAPILKLLAGENETLLVRRNSFLILNLGFNIVNGIRRLNLKGDGLSGKGFDEDLHATTETEDQV